MYCSVQLKNRKRSSSLRRNEFARGVVDLALAVTFGLARQDYLANFSWRDIGTSWGNCGQCSFPGSECISIMATNDVLNMANATIPLAIQKDYFVAGNAASKPGMPSLPEEEGPTR